MKSFKKLITFLGILFLSAIPSFAENHSATTEFSVVVPKYLNIKPVTSPVLTANITSRTGNLHTPLSTRFRVVSNASEKFNLYLKANVVTDGGYEEAMFIQGGQVYIAFGSLSKTPSSSALANCKIGSSPKDSPGIVAYPVTSITGAEKTFLAGKNKYELTVDPGVQDITVNVGSSVLRNSFAANDPRGFYQAVLSLTEADI